MTRYRKVALFEGLDEYGRLQPLLGAEVNGEFKAIPWHADTTENPAVDATEIWEIYNFTGDAHPVHLHLINFEILGRNEMTFDKSGRYVWHCHILSHEDHEMMRVMHVGPEA